MLGSIAYSYGGGMAYQPLPDREYRYTIEMRRPFKMSIDIYKGSIDNSPVLRNWTTLHVGNGVLLDIMPDMDFHTKIACYVAKELKKFGLPLYFGCL